MYEWAFFALEKLFARMKSPDSAPSLTTFLPSLMPSAVVRGRVCSSEQLV